MRVTIITALMIALVLPPVTLAAEPLILTPKTAAERALAQNLSLRTTETDIVTKKRRVDTAWNFLLPSLSLGAGLTHTTDYSEKAVSSTGGGTASAQETSPWDLSLSVTAGLPLSTATVFSVRETLLQYEAGLIDLEEAKRGLEWDIKKSFYSLLLLEERVALFEQNLATAESNLEITRKKYEKGLVPVLDLLSAQVDLESIKPDLEEAQVSYETALMEFKQLLGLSQEMVIDLDGSIEITAMAEEGDRQAAGDLENRTDIRSLVKEIQILENEKSLTIANEFVPDLSLSYTYSGSMSDPFGAEWADMTRKGTFRISLSMPIDPLFPGSPSRIKVAQAEDTPEKTRIELTRTRELAEIEIESLILNLERSQNKIETLENKVDLNGKLHQIREREYDAGLTDLLTVLEAYDDLRSARLNVLTERYSYRTILLDLEYALGKEHMLSK